MSIVNEIVFSQSSDLIGLQGVPKKSFQIQIFMLIGPSWIWFHDLRKMMDSLKEDKKGPRHNAVCLIYMTNHNQHVDVVCSYILIKIN